jgi:hypothetical protein
LREQTTVFFHNNLEKSPDCAQGLELIAHQKEIPSADDSLIAEIIGSNQQEKTSDCYSAFEDRHHSNNGSVKERGSVPQPQR